jgi:hypothetical protein
MNQNLSAFLFLICFFSFEESKCQEIVPAADSIQAKAYIIQLSTTKEPELPANFDEISRFNFYGICWNGKPDDNLKFARQMGYSYVMYQPGMEKSPLAKDLYFYMESPEYHVYSTLGVDRSLDKKKAYTEEQKLAYQKNFALKKTDMPFPENMASGWFLNDRFSVEPDWQQQRVIDYYVSQLKTKAGGIENADNKFLFAGLAWDVPQFKGDFYANGKQVSLEFWNGKDSSALFQGNTHEYKRYSEGKVAYYLSIKKAFKEIYPDRKLGFIFEPYNYYDWFKDLFKLDGAKQEELMHDVMIVQESGVTKWSTGTEFVDDNRVYRSGIMAKSRAGSTTPDNHDLASNKLIVAKAAINGSWVSWYGRFSGSGDRVPMKHIYEVPNWLQLIRMVANWDNLNGVSITARRWDGSTYLSPNSRIDDNIIYSRQPKTQKLFVVFLNGKGEIKLNPGEKVVSIKNVDRFFCETTDAAGELKVEGNKITPHPRPFSSKERGDASNKVLEQM